MDLGSTVGHPPSLRATRPPRWRRTGLCLGISLALHLLLGVLVSHREALAPTPGASPPQRFVKRLPYPRRPLSRRMLPEPIQRPLTRHSATRAAPGMAMTVAPLTSQRQGMRGVPIPLVEAHPPPSLLPALPLSHLPLAAIDPRPATGSLEGVRVRGRLVGLYSLKNYADVWAGQAERTRDSDKIANLVNGRFSNGGEQCKPSDLGINVLVYALTREGSLAQQLVATE